MDAYWKRRSPTRQKSFVFVCGESSSLTLVICCPTPKAGYFGFSGRCLWTIRSGSPTASWMRVWVYSTAAISTVNHCATTRLSRLRTAGIVLSSDGAMRAMLSGAASTLVVRPKPGRITDTPTTDSYLPCVLDCAFLCSSVTSSCLTYP